MKKILSLILLFAYVQYASAQFAIVNDTINGNTGFVLKSYNNTEVRTIPNGSVVYIYPYENPTDSLRPVDLYSTDGGVVRGYMDDLVLNRIEDYEIVEVERLSAHGFVLYGNDSIKVTITTDRSTGDDKARFRSIEINNKGKKTSVPYSMLKPFIKPLLDETTVYLDDINNRIFIVGRAYEPKSYGRDIRYMVLWVIPPDGNITMYRRATLF